MKFKKLFLLAFIGFAVSCSTLSPLSSKNSCEAIQGALDVGSGSLKAMVAKVNTCEKRVIEVLFSEQAPVAFKESLDKSSDQSIDSKTINQAHKKFLSFVKSMKKLGAHPIQAVATSALRDAKNGPQVIKEVARGTRVKIRVISQNQEAEIGYHSALLNAPEGLTEEQVVVWDIGGGSMQISYSADKEVHVFKGQLASVSFKNQVISLIQKKSPKAQATPNPLEGFVTKSVQLSQDHGQKHLPKDLIAMAPKKTWLGIGGVWWHSVRGQVKPESGILTSKEILKALSRISELSDSEIGGAYASTEGTNLALTLGYMKALGLDQVRPIKASLVEGLLFYKFN